MSHERKLKDGKKNTKKKATLEAEIARKGNAAARSRSEQGEAPTVAQVVPKEDYRPSNSSQR